MQEGLPDRGGLRLCGVWPGEVAIAIADRHLQQVTARGFVRKTLPSWPPGCPPCGIRLAVLAIHGCWSLPWGRVPQPQLPQLTMQVSDCIDTPRVKMPLHGGAFDRFVEFEGLEQVALFGREAPGADDSLVVDVDGVFLDLAQYRQRAPW